MKIDREWLEKHNACAGGAEWFLDENILELSDGVKNLLAKGKFDWANWLLTRNFNKSQNIAYAIYAAEQVLDIFEKKVPGDFRPREAIRAAKKYLRHPTGAKATYAVADATYAAADAAYAAACAAAYAAACAAAKATYSTDEACAAANAACAAACAAAKATYAVADAACAAANATDPADPANEACAAAYAAAKATYAIGAANSRQIKNNIILYGLKLIEKGGSRND
jgi:hypothetical protein